MIAVSRLSRLWRFAVSHRYVLLAVWTAAWSIPIYERFWDKPNDFYIFNYAGRALLGNMPGYHAGALHIYAQHPEVQVGPPTLLLNGLLNPLPARLSLPLWSLLIAALGLLTVRAAEGIARQFSTVDRAAMTALGGGAILLASWSAFYQYFHLEDAIAVCCVAWAVALLLRRRPWWAPALLLGFAATCKPWAIVAVPMLLGLPSRRTRALLLTLIWAAVWWLPFVIAAPHTVQAVGNLPAVIFPRSAMATYWPSGLMGPPGLRLMQFGFAALLGTLALRRRGVAAVPMAGLAAKMLLDPRYYSYYAIGPIAAALIWDAACHRRIPVWTAAASACTLIVPLFAPNAVTAWTQAAYGVLALMAVFGRVRIGSRNVAKADSNDRPLDDQQTDEPDLRRTGAALS